MSCVYVDWLVDGRTDRYYIKQYEEETNLRAFVVLDASSSMRYASPGNVSKYEYAVSLAAALSLLMLKQRDAVGAAIYDTEMRSYLPPSSRPSYLQELLKTLAASAPQERSETGTASALSRLAERTKRRGLVIVLSDFFDDVDSVDYCPEMVPPEAERSAGVEIFDPLERSFDFGTDATFMDMETGEEMVTQPFQIRKAYAQAMEDFTEELKRKCREHRIDYALLDTSTPYDVALIEYLNKRRKVG